MQDIYFGYCDIDKPFKLNGWLTNGFDYDEDNGQVLFRCFDGFGTVAVADISFSKTQWREIARCSRSRLWGKLEAIFGDE